MKKTITPEPLTAVEPTIRRNDLGGFAQSIATHARLVNTSVELSKRPLQRFRLAVNALGPLSHRAAENLAERKLLAESIASIKVESALLLDLDASLRWGLGLVEKGCSALLAALNRPDSDYNGPEVETDEAMLSARQAHRAGLLDALDELNTRAHAFGDNTHGGMEEREALFAGIAQLRSALCSKNLNDDPSPYVERVTEIKGLCQTQSRLTSKLTGEGFNFRPLEANLSQCDLIIRLLESAPHPPQRSLVPVISSRQLQSRPPLSRHFGWETA